MPITQTFWDNNRFWVQNLQCIFLSVPHDGIHVVQRPIHQLIEQWDERLSALCQLVFHTRRHLGIDGPGQRGIAAFSAN